MCITIDVPRINDSRFRARQEKEVYNITAYVVFSLRSISVSGATPPWSSEMEPAVIAGLYVVTCYVAHYMSLH
jgi:hypothetical protein